MPRRGVGTLALLAAVCCAEFTSAAPAPRTRRLPRPTANASRAEYFETDALADQETPVAGNERVVHYNNQWQESPASPTQYVGDDADYEAAEYIEGNFDSGEFVDDGGFGDGGYGDEFCDTCGPCEGGCGPTWFAEAGALFLHRSTAHDQTVTQTPVIFTIAGIQIVVNVPLQSTRSFDFDYAAGLRTNIGRYLGTDLLNRDHTAEFMYYGLQEWNATHQIVSERIESFFPDGQGGLTAVRIGRLFTPFPSEVGGWNRADVHHIQNFSTFNNFEVNYRIRWRQGRSRLVGWPDGTWTRECNPGRTPSILAGIRYISLNDHFRFASSGAIENLDTDNSFPMSGLYKTDTSNDLFGGQIGGELAYQWCNFKILARGKTGLFCNVTQQFTHLETQDTSGLFRTPNRDYHVRGDRLGFVGEFGFEGTWQIWPSVALKLAYDFLWVQGVSLAPEQIEFSIEAPPRLIDSGNVFFQGASIGCEVKW